jgi:hypothetical protein
MGRHPGMVCLCGHSIWNRMASLLKSPSNTITFDNWERISANDLYKDIAAYNAFKSMVASLLKSRAHKAVLFHRYYI